jgi:hypothetical protein
VVSKSITAMRVMGRSLANCQDVDCWVDKLLLN